MATDEIIGACKDEHGDITLEELFAQLDEILQKMETGDRGIDELFALYEEGLKKLKLCSDKLNLIEKKMLVLRGGSTEEFE